MTVPEEERADNVSARDDERASLARRLAQLRAACTLLRKARADEWPDRAADLAKALVAADRVMLVVLNGQQGSSNLEVVALTGGGQGSAGAQEKGPGPPGAFAMAAARQVLDGTHLLLGVDATGPAWSPEGGAADQRPGALLVVPLSVRGAVRGALYAERSGATAFDEVDLRVMELFGDQVAAGLERLNGAWQRDSGEFVSLVSHQLRIPLTAMVGYTDLLLAKMAGPLTERQEDFLTTIRRNMARMNRLIDDLSTLNRLQSGRLQMQAERVTAAEVLQKAVESMRQTVAAREQSLAPAFQPDLPDLETDPDRLGQIVARLIDNASSYSEPGTLIEVRAESVSEGIDIKVIDNGIGISEADQQRLFVPFFRSENSAVRETDGWGLSLPLAYHTVSALGGRLTCQSAPGQGSTFTITLPAADPVAG
jgi:signal transduction histidine kinase